MLLASAIPTIPLKGYPGRGPARRLKLGNEGRNLRRVEQYGELSNRRERWYLVGVHGVLTSVVQAPGDSRLAGVIFFVTWTPNLPHGSDGTPASNGLLVLSCSRVIHRA